MANPFTNLPPSSMPSPSRPPSRTPLIVGITSGVLLLCCIIPIIAAALNADRLSKLPLFSPATRATLTAAARATIAPDLTPTPEATMLLSESLKSPDPEWVQDTHCSFHSDGYHIQSGYVCAAPVPAVKDFDAQVTMRQLSGSITLGYGLLFRVVGQLNAGDYYAFFIDGNGKWFFGADQGHTFKRLIDFTPSTAIQFGLGTDNTLRVHAEGTHFTFYINGQQVGSMDDASFSAGGIALLSNEGMEVVFTNITVREVTCSPYSNPQGCS